MLNLETKVLFEHPDNPRKDLGDLTELAESIKKNGVLQNLTVVYKLNDDGNWDEENFTVIIGHRRLAAAKLAGLKTVPCTLAHMDYKKQIETMLCENIQRSDLTAYEQAQGFQMMIDLGSSVADIVKDTGFSDSTVRRRLKMAELDPDLMKEKSAMQIPITDYMKLDQIEDIGIRNEVLKSIGTNNFDYALRNAIDTEEKHKKFDEIAEKVREWADEEIPDDEFQIDFINDNNLFCYKTFYTWQDLDDMKDEIDVALKEIDKKILDGKMKYCLIEDYKSIKLILEKDETEEDEETDEESEKRLAKEREREERYAKLNNISNNIKKMHDDFIKEITEAECRENKEEIIEALIDKFIDGRSHMDRDNVARLTGFKAPEGFSYWDDEYINARKDQLDNAKETQKYKLLAQMVYVTMYESSMHNYNAQYLGEDKRPWKLEYITNLGYVPSDTERGYMEGTLKEFLKE